MSPSRLPCSVTLAEAVPGRARRGLREEATLELLVELLLGECGPGAMQGLRARPGRCQATQRSPHQVEKPGPPGPQEAWAGGSALTSDTTRRGATIVWHPAVITFVKYNSFPGKRFIVFIINIMCTTNRVCHNAIQTTKVCQTHYIAHVFRVPKVAYLK